MLADEGDPEISGPYNDRIAPFNRDYASCLKAIEVSDKRPYRERQKVGNRARWQAPVAPECETGEYKLDFSNAEGTKSWEQRVS